jgi:hypothetical protein
MPVPQLADRLPMVSQWAQPLQRRFIKGATRDSELISVSRSVGAVPRGLVVPAGPVGHETKKTIGGSGRNSEGHPTGREEALDTLDVLVVDEAALGRCAMAYAYMKEAANCDDCNPLILSQRGPSRCNCIRHTQRCVCRHRLAPIPNLQTSSVRGISGMAVVQFQ